MIDQKSKEFKEAEELWRKIDYLDELGNEMEIIRILMELLKKGKKP
jgi:hypothetical protein